MAVVICLSLAACGEGEELQIDGFVQGVLNNGSNGEQQDDGEGGLKEHIGGVTWNAMNFESWMSITTTEFGQLSEGGYPCGTWEVSGNTVTFTYSEDSLTGLASQPKTYQIKEKEGVYFLVSDTELLSSVSADKVPVTKVEITLDNWQEYFEFAMITTVTKNTDVWGEATETTKETRVLKLKDVYLKQLNAGASSIAVRVGLPESDASNAYTGEYMRLDYLYRRVEKVAGSSPAYLDIARWFGLGDGENGSFGIASDHEVIRIQGILALVDGL